MPSCRTCELVARRDADETPLWDRIVRTAAWDVVHAFGTSVEGWTCLVLRRHITAVADMNDHEAAELGPLIRDVSRSLHDVLGCEKTYVVQFAEHPQYPHVHVHVIPRSGDLPSEHRGPRIFELGNVPADAEVPESRKDDIARAMRPLLDRYRASDC